MEAVVYQLGKKIPGSARYIVLGDPRHGAPNMAALQALNTMDVVALELNTYGDREIPKLSHWHLIGKSVTHFRWNHHGSPGRVFAESFLPTPIDSSNPLLVLRARWPLLRHLEVQWTTPGHKNEGVYLIQCLAEAKRKVPIETLVVNQMEIDRCVVENAIGFTTSVKSVVRSLGISMKEILRSAGTLFTLPPPVLVDYPAHAVDLFDDDVDPDVARMAVVPALPTLPSPTHEFSKREVCALTGAQVVPVGGVLLFVDPADVAAWDPFRTLCGDEPVFYSALKAVDPSTRRRGTALEQSACSKYTIKGASDVPRTPHKALAVFPCPSIPREHRAEYQESTHYKSGTSKPSLFPGCDIEHADAHDDGEGPLHVKRYKWAGVPGTGTWLQISNEWRAAVALMACSSVARLITHQSYAQDEVAQIAYERAPGVPLSKLKGLPFTGAARLVIAKRIDHALSSFHATGMVHNAITEQSVFYDFATGRVTLTDLSLATLQSEDAYFKSFPPRIGEGQRFDRLCMTRALEAVDGEWKLDPSSLSSLYWFHSNEQTGRGSLTDQIRSARIDAVRLYVFELRKFTAYGVLMQPTYDKNSKALKAVYDSSRKASRELLTDLLEAKSREQYVGHILKGVYGASFNPKAYSSSTDALIRTWFSCVDTKKYEDTPMVHYALPWTTIQLPSYPTDIHSLLMHRRDDAARSSTSDSYAIGDAPRSYNDDGTLTPAGLAVNRLRALLHLPQTMFYEQLNFVTRVDEKEVLIDHRPFASKGMVFSKFLRQLSSLNLDLTPAYIAHITSVLKQVLRTAHLRGVAHITPTFDAFIYDPEVHALCLAQWHHCVVLSQECNNANWNADGLALQTGEDVDYCVVATELYDNKFVSAASEILDTALQHRHTRSHSLFLSTDTSGTASPFHGARVRAIQRWYKLVAGELSKLFGLKSCFSGLSCDEAIEWLTAVHAPSIFASCGIEKKAHATELLIAEQKKNAIRKKHQSFKLRSEKDTAYDVFSSVTKATWAARRRAADEWKRAFQAAEAKAEADLRRRLEAIQKIDC